MTLSNNGTTGGFEPSAGNLVDSATEDESEDELSNRPTLEIISTRTVDTVAFDGENLEESVEYINSLPNTVRDFEVMFGGSLPGDFPMSLRQHTHNDNNN
jgi:hypothetical protein